MRLMLFCLLVFSSAITTVQSLASNRLSTLEPWEVLEGCRLVESPVNDGDSFKLMHKDKVFIIRLYYVDCPETYDTYQDRLQDQANYFSIPEAQVITSGKTAKAFTQKFLKGEFTVITRWEATRGVENMRYFGILRKENRLLSTELVRNGLARIYGMPTKGSWPGGYTPKVYLKQLKQSERIAQQAGKGIWHRTQKSAQFARLEKTGNRTEIPGAPSSKSAWNNSSRIKKLVLNTASAEDLETLPGIGPILADRIITARPFTELDELTGIPGISMKKLDAFRDCLVVDEPQPPAMTADFYRANLETYLNKEVTVRVSMVAHSELTAPDGFQSVDLETSNQGEPGGSITAFVPNEHYDSFMHHSQQPNREFKGLFFQHNETIVLVYRYR